MDVALEDNHIALLQHRAKNSGNTVLFKLPILRGSEPPQEWNHITVAEFAAEVDRVAIFVMTELKARGIPPRSAVTVLYSGSRYQDLIYAIALARASYIPQMCPHILTHPGVIFALMEKAGSKIILYDPSLEPATTDCPYPKMALNPIETIDSSSTINSDSALPTIEDLSSGHADVCFFYLTSGSTSGSPKVVPLTQKFVSTYYKTQFGIWLDGRRFDTQNAFLSRGSICAVAPIIQYFGCLYTGSCIVQPSKMRFSTEELLTLVNVCGLNRMTTFGTWLAPHIQAAKKDPAALKLLQEMRTVSYGGVPISIADDDWCFQNGIPLMDMYATTECGTLMVSAPGKPARFMQPVPGISYRFDPFTDTTTGADNPASTQLLKLILLADSPQIPQPQLLSEDGNFHTGDLFEKQLDGSYLFRGRGDDWIKSEDSRFIDTKAIEEKINDVCSDLVKGCIVVGHLRPSPALFIEAYHDSISTISEDGLKELVLRRLEDFNARQLKHERITDKRLIFIVDEGNLPRTV
ncbi:hypothetical protein M378DRAFT_88879 [Amanita muscaria Koide BX008]|uniref:AMP-binding domain-containing enzyme iboA n=1 Tax=Amanita muscaria (strain Koide BX008) TaxID=946122 RepID=IBOA_AMAMK|nr:RecName: Full=AMP-binding domain-containing enzyme iboA; AltName: Full=Ibotenic acid biosynthesis cluster protein A [Amanita muscaria Koide BX008]KIL56732.1 hypothetical protein M378DRAFT_88879 [Amanita muscaria Koide BX008]